MKRNSKSTRSSTALAQSDSGPALARSSPIPLYHQLATRMRDEILNGVLEPGSQYYSDRQLIERYGVSLLTARQAMSELVTAQLLERRQGSGTFISQRVAKMREKSQSAATAILFTGWSPTELSGWDAMYFRDIFEGMQAEVQARGLHIIFDDIRAHSPEKIAAEAKARGIRGALALIGKDSEKRSNALAAAGIPIVAVNFPAKGIPSIVADDFAGAQLAVRHLLSLGHRRLAHINSGETTLHWMEVKRGFRETIAEAGLSAEQNPVFESQQLRGTIDVGYEQADKVLAMNPRPTAIFSGNDLMAIGALRLLHERGVNVPRDISVMGFDNIEAAEICSPKLSTVAVERKEMGHAAVRLLLDPAPKTDLKPIGVRLVERESTSKV